MTREELADILARTYDGVSLTDLRDEHAADHLEAADAVLEALTPQGDPMTDRLTTQQLDEIAARADAATRGPWGFYDGDTYADIAADLEQTRRGSYSYREKVARLEDENYWDDPAHEDHDEERAPEQMAANAAFIAHAREDVPALLAELSAVRAERDTARAERDAARARVAELEEERRLEWMVQGTTPHTPRLCSCGHSHHAHAVPAPHACFAHGKTCPCEAYQQLPHKEALAQLDRNRRAVEGASQ